jgi:hypothetical protein
MAQTRDTPTTPKGHVPPIIAHGGIAIVYRPLRELVPYIRNARTHTPAQISKIGASLQTFGWTNPMLIAGDDMIAGHARLQAAMGLAERGESIPRNPDPWTGPTVDLSHLNDGERRAYILTDNRTAEEAGWDKELLAIEFEALKAADMGLLGITAFDPSEISTIMAGWSPEMGQINDTEANLSDMLATIRVKCAKPDFDAVLAAIKEAIKGMEGVSIAQ